MLITAVEPRKKSLSALYIHGEYAVSIDTVTLAASGFREGSEIDDDQLHDLIETSNVNRAKEKALYLIEYRARTRKEIEDKLKIEYGEKAAVTAVERLQELGLIDDEGFAKEYAYQLLVKKKYSEKRTLYEMLKKGIDKELAEEIIEELGIDPEEQIRYLLETKYAKLMNDEGNRKKVVSTLAGMGFSWYDINSVVNEYW